MIKRLLLFSYLIILSFNLFPQQLLDSIFEAIKYPKVPENKSIVYFLRTKFNMSTAYFPRSISVILPKDTILMASLVYGEYSYEIFNPGEYSFLTSNFGDTTNILLEPNRKYYMNYSRKNLSSNVQFRVIEKEDGNQKLPKLKISSDPSWVILFYEVIEDNISDSTLKSLTHNEQETFFSNYLENSKYITGKLIGVSKESFFIENNGKIIEFDNLECKSIFFLKEIRPSGSISSEKTSHHLLEYIAFKTCVYLSYADLQVRIRDGLFFRGDGLLEYIFFFQSFFDHMDILYDNEAVIKINSSKDYYKLEKLNDNQ